MASRASEARQHCMGMYPQQCKFNDACESFHGSTNESDFVIKCHCRPFKSDVT